MCCQGLGLGVWDIALWDGGASQGHGAGPAGCRWQHAVLASWPAQLCAPAWQCKLQELTSQPPDQPCPRCLARAATHGAASAGFHGFGGRQRLCCVTAVPAGSGCGLDYELAGLLQSRDSPALHCPGEQAGRCDPAGSVRPPRHPCCALQMAPLSSPALGWCSGWCQGNQGPVKGCYIYSSGEGCQIETALQAPPLG